MLMTVRTKIDKAESLLISAKSRLSKSWKRFSSSSPSWLFDVEAAAPLTANRTTFGLNKGIIFDILESVEFKVFLSLMWLESFIENIENPIRNSK